MKTLYLFATSSRPDPYINAIAYSVDHLGVDSIFIVVVSEHDYLDEKPEAELLATEVLANIMNQLQALRAGSYLVFGGGGQGSHSAQESLANPEDKAIYAQCLDILNKSGGTQSIVLPYKELASRLAGYVRSRDCIFDVSALKRNLLVDIVATFLSMGFSQVYSFELHKKPSFRQDDLYHSLGRGDFVFRNLARSELVDASLRRMTRSVVRSKAIMLFTALLAGVFLLLRTVWPGPEVLDYFNVAAIIASIGSYLLQFREGG